MRALERDEAGEYHGRCVCFRPTNSASDFFLSLSLLLLMPLLVVVVVVTACFRNLPRAQSTTF